MGANFAGQHAGREGWQAGLDDAIGTDDGGHAGIGGAQHRAAGFRARIWAICRCCGWASERIAEPRGIGQVGGMPACGRARMISSPKRPRSRC